MNKIYPFSFYFLYFAALACLAPFLVLFYQELGLSGTQIGILTGIAPLITLVGGPFWSGVADTNHRHKWVMSIGLGAAVLTGLVFPLLKSMGAVLLVISLFTFFTAAVVALGDSATMASLGEEKSKYGRVRLGGTMGWALAAPVIGYFVERQGLTVNFWSYAGLMFLALLVSLRFVYPQHLSSGSMRQGLQYFLASRRWILFLSLAITSGMGLVAINNYLFAYMKELQATESVMGIALTLSTIAEVPVLFFANVMLKRIGTIRLLRMAVFLTALRMLIFVMFNSVPGVLISQLLNGFNFPLFWAAGVSFADEHAPAGMKSTAQGLFGSVTFGIGSALGGFVGGMLIDVVGIRAMFLYTGLFMLVCIAALIIIERLWVKEEAVPSDVMAG